MAGKEKEGTGEEMKNKCLPIPEILLPFVPADPKINSPAFFTPTPRIKMLKRGGCILLDNVEWRNRHGLFRTTPRGLIFDGMSYPWLARKLFGLDKYDPNTLRTAATHDCPYTANDYLCNWPVTRREADTDLLDCLRCEQPRFAWLKYRAVRRSGWVLWAYQSNDPIIREWFKVLREGDVVLDKWIEKIILTEGV